MKVTRTPAEHYFEGGSVIFHTSRKDGELYYEISQWLGNKTALIVSEEGKVKDEAHLKELQSMETEIEN